MDESELDAADLGVAPAGYEQDVALPILPQGSGSLPVSVPGSSEGKRPSDAFVSAGKHILYCGTDLVVDGAAFHTSPRKHGNHSLLSRGSGALRRSISGRGSDADAACGDTVSIDGPELKRLRSDDPSSNDGTAGGVLGAREGSAQEGEPDDEAQDDVLEVETDTPGGFHVSAVVTHHRDANDPEEYIVEAVVHP